MCFDIFDMKIICPLRFERALTEAFLCVFITKMGEVNATLTIRDNGQSDIDVIRQVLC